MLTVMAAVGWIWGRASEGMSLEEIEDGRARGLTCSSTAALGHARLDPFYGREWLILGELG
jgi:hypothetical protein